jgi:hypothetical protein
MSGVGDYGWKARCVGLPKFGTWAVLQAVVWRVRPTTLPPQTETAISSNAALVPENGRLHPT